MWRSIVIYVFHMGTATHMASKKLEVVETKLPISAGDFDGWCIDNGKIHEPGHVKTCLMSYANTKGVDQPAHPRSLISAFVVRCLDSIISLVSISEIPSL